MPQTIKIINDSGRRARGVSITLRPDSALKFTVLYGPERALVVGRFGRWIGVLFKGAIDENAEFAIEVEGRVEGEHKPELTWIPDDEADIRTMDVVITRRDPAMEVLHQLSLQAAPLELGVASAFFYEMENETQPAMLALRGDVDANDRAAREALLMYSIGRLEARLSERGRVDPLTETIETPPIAYWSALLLGLVRKHFGDPADPANVTAFETAVEHFASGQLRPEVQLGVDFPNTAPDGGRVFLFAEIAIAAIDQQVDATDWTPLLGVLVRMQNIYLYSVGWQQGAMQDYGQYGPPDPDPTLSRSQMIDSVRDYYATNGITTPPLLVQQAGVNAVWAFTPWP